MCFAQIFSLYNKSVQDTFHIKRSQLLKNMLFVYCLFYLLVSVYSIHLWDYVHAPAAAADEAMSYQVSRFEDEILDSQLPYGNAENNKSRRKEKTVGYKINILINTCILQNESL